MVGAAAFVRSPTPFPVTQTAVRVRDAGATRTARLQSADGFRGLAMSLVFLVHFHAIFSGYLAPGSTSHGISVFLSNTGRAGTDFFLALSGYFIYGSLMRQRSSYWGFIRRRAERILPPFYAVLGLYLVLSWLVPAENRIPSDLAAGARYVAQNALLLAGVLPIQPLITVTWSLSYIFAFYLLLPIFLSLTGMRRLRPRTRVLLLLAAVLALLLAKLLGARFNIRVLMFFPGMLLHEALASERLGRRLGRGAEILAALLFVASFPAGHMLASRRDVGVDLHALELAHQVLRLLVLGLVSILIGLQVFRPRTAVARLLAARPLPRLGQISYSFYLVHGLTLKALGLVAAGILATGPQPALLYWSLLPLSFLAALGVARVFFAIVERHSLSPDHS